MKQIRKAKKLLHFSIVICFLGIFFTGCSDDTGPGTDPPGPDNQIPALQAGEIMELSNTDYGYHARYSPDGSKIAFTTRNQSTGEMKLWIRENSDGSSRVVVENMTGDMTISWSPDSEKIVFEAHAENQSIQLWVKNILTNELTQITSQAQHCFQPDWAHSGDRIVYAGGGGLKILDVVTGLVTSIPNTSGGGSPAWSPDDSRIVFSIQTNGLNMTDLFLIDPDGSDKRQITTYEDRDGRARWSPDGRFIAYEKFDIQRTDIAIYELESEIKYIITLGAMPDWSPDGSSILFVNNTSLWELDLIEIN